jgi:hypothetical protein
LLAVLLTLIWAFYLVRPAGGAIQAVENASIPALMILNPYVSLAAVMSGSVAEVMAGMVGSSGAGAALGPLGTWALLTGLFLLLGLALWGLAVRTFAKRG